LSRAPDNTWSRRRAAVSAEAEIERRAADAATRAQRQAELEEKSDADILKELKLQDPEAMQAGDDFAAFMREDVPERLRKRALRALWRSNPVLACVDDLVEYGEDFKAEWTPGEVIRTAYQVGKGMLAHVQEMERQAKAEAAIDADEVDEVEEIAVEPMSGPEVEPEVETAMSDAEAEPPAPGPDVEPQEDEPQYVPLRRMRFEFDGAA